MVALDVQHPPFRQTPPVRVYLLSVIYTMHRINVICMNLHHIILGDSENLGPPPNHRKRSHNRAEEFLLAPAKKCVMFFDWHGGLVNRFVQDCFCCLSGLGVAGVKPSLLGECSFLIETIVQHIYEHSCTSTRMAEMPLRPSNIKDPRVHLVGRVRLYCPPLFLLALGEFAFRRVPWKGT